MWFLHTGQGKYFNLSGKSKTFKNSCHNRTYIPIFSDEQWFLLSRGLSTKKEFSASQKHNIPNCVGPLRVNGITMNLFFLNRKHRIQFLWHIICEARVKSAHQIYRKYRCLSEGGKVKYHKIIAFTSVLKVLEAGRIQIKSFTEI